MSPRTKSILSTVGLCLSAIGTTLVTIANTGCAGGYGEYGLKADVTAFKRPPSASLPTPAPQAEAK